MIQDLRAYLQLSQAAFAKPIGLSPTHIARFEKGVSSPTEEIISRICKAFVVDRAYFQNSGSLSVADAVNKEKAESDVAERLRNAREEKGWSQHELGKRAHVASSIINRVEFGAKLTQKQGIKLAETLEIGYEWLMEGIEEKRYYPADQKMIDWLWEHEEVRKKLWKQMKE